MSRFVQFDPFSGISGDMTLAALIDAGASVEYIHEGLRHLPLIPDGTHLVCDHVVRHAIRASRVDVVSAGGEKIDRMMAQEGEGNHGHEHSHAHGHHHHHSHDHDHTHDHEHHHHHPAGGHEHHHGDGGTSGEGYAHHHHHVTFRQIAQAIDSSQLPERVRRRSIDIFRAIAVGEGRVHGVEVEDVHFHEVGAVDSIVDIVGVALALEDLGIDRIYSKPVSRGSGGMIRSQHGMIPIPAPATLEILRGVPVQSTDIRSELTTPTGAGIIAALSEGIGPAGSYTVSGTGFGGGTKDLEARPNILRIVLGEENPASESAARSTFERDTVLLLEANVDDMSPEAWPLVTDRLFELGALDVWLTPVQMKKGRPGVLLSILVPPDLRGALEREIFRGTTTIGIRSRSVSRSKLKRTEETIETVVGPVRVKVIHRETGEEIRPEAEEIIRFARNRELSFSEAERILRDAIDHARSQNRP